MAGLTLTYYNIGGGWRGLWRAGEEGRLGCADNGTELNPPHQTDGISGQTRPGRIKVCQSVKRERPDQSGPDKSLI